ncbi:hypothetical protein BpHYR1_015276 [Brachionus plicatilis]|uniref:Transmembrane protein n=1 Tax=Brachionus plicatilis TaxID=10195 RepID=A0A3M7Q8F9_BRAPC|nr:hypothetical protein BpHYR1_015276 [Brachionus plicatilis]
MKIDVNFGENVPYTLARYCIQLNPKLILSACIPYHLSHVNPTLLINPCIYPVSLRGFKIIVFGLSGLLPQTIGVSWLILIYIYWRFCVTKPATKQTSAGCNKLVMRGGIKLVTIPFTCYSSFTLLVK